LIDLGEHILTFRVVVANSIAEVRRGPAIKGNVAETGMAVAAASFDQMIRAVMA
jgi:hypothetical protein